jgi:hypothetical protein
MGVVIYLVARRRRENVASCAGEVADAVGVISSQNTGKRRSNNGAAHMPDGSQLHLYDRIVIDECESAASTFARLIGVCRR